MATYVGQVHEVLIEGVSKRSDQFMFGRITLNAVVIVPRFSEQLSVISCPAAGKGDGRDESSLRDLTTNNQQLTTPELRPGDLIQVRITSATAGSLQGEPLAMMNATAPSA